MESRYLLDTVCAAGYVIGDRHVQGYVDGLVTNGRGLYLSAISLIVLYDAVYDRSIGASLERRNEMVRGLGDFENVIRVVEYDESHYKVVKDKFGPLIVEGRQIDHFEYWDIFTASTAVRLELSVLTTKSARYEALKHIMDFEVVPVPVRPQPHPPI